MLNLLCLEARTDLSALTPALAVSTGGALEMSLQGRC